MSMLLGVIAVFALLSLIVAAIQAAAIIKLAPAGERIGSFMVLGWWKFASLQTKAGPTAAEHVQIYTRAAIAFLIFVILGVILSGWAVSQSPAVPTAATSSLTTNPGSVPVDYAFTTDLRRVAMPGVPLSES
ncbi:MAG: hypothetical protein ACOH2L_09095 [Devosia sp.]